MLPAQDRTFSVQLHKIKFIPLYNLIGFTLAQQRFKMFDETSDHILKIDHNRSSIGAFKTAHMGQVDISPFNSRTLDICVKQVHELDKRSALFLLFSLVVER